MRPALALLVLAACKPAPPAQAPPAPPPAAPTDALEIARTRGAWRWVHSSTSEGTYRLERERWLIDPIALDRDRGRRVARGRYRRDVAIVALDGRRFLCNQRTSYVQTAVFDVEVSIEDGALAIAELGYRTQPSPCEPGFRHPVRYRAALDDRRLVLAWDGGDQTLQPLPDDAFTAGELELAEPPADPAARLAGAWRWSLRGTDKANDVRDEHEAWELAVGADGVVGGTYVRDVTVHAADGAPLACAGGATSYRYVDRYTLRGRVDGDQLVLEEHAVDAGAHPCLATTPRRHLDSATGVAIGDHLVLTWRGKRRQVLHRP